MNFSDVYTLTPRAQGTILDRIDYNLEQVSTEVASGLVQLRKVCLSAHEAIKDVCGWSEFRSLYCLCRHGRDAYPTLGKHAIAGRGVPEEVTEEDDVHPSLIYRHSDHDNADILKIIKCQVFPCDFNTKLAYRLPV